MKKKLGLLFVAGLVALLLVSIYVLGFATVGWKGGTERVYGTRSDKLNYTYCVAQDTAKTLRNPSVADYPADLIALVQVEACTTATFDLHYYTHMNSQVCITDRNADTGHVNVALETSLNGSIWSLADTLNGSATDSTIYVKDWTFPVGSVYGRIIYRSQCAAACSSSVNQAVHCWTQY